jgi:hypothetical protein
MIDDAPILAIERLRDELEEFKSALRQKYSNSDRQVVDQKLKATAARLAEAWIVNIAQRPEVTGAISADYLADLSVGFQRLLTLSEHASKRSRYESEIKIILRDFNLKLVIPLKQLRTRVSHTQPLPPSAGAQSEVSLFRGVGLDHFLPTAFVGYSFAPTDKIVIDCIIETLTSIGIKVVTGEKPKAEKISEKVKKLIEEQYLFVGIFTRRDKIAHKKEWTTSPWVLDEKAYALGRGKKLILLKEQGVQSIGGIQGDYEFIEFSRDAFEKVPSRLIGMFEISISGLRA